MAAQAVPSGDSPSGTVVYETISSQLPVETVITVTMGSQILTSTVSTAVAVQTPSVTAAPILSTVYVTMGSGASSTVLTNTVTASEVVAADTVTLTLTGSAGVASTYVMTVSQATTVTGQAARPTITQRPSASGQGYAGVGGQCNASTVTLISVSTLCATGSVCAAQATGL